ncbi:hypothetical protein [Actinoallomurus rhizosphaericola]|uniref:hypothetical protein n=1 Tax=Actinoallomurus rhizosphaericola TaxID=2952536 RepID=UPI0020901CEA|nr:hypothetical protein [Actinoallomurus rhizosphaericola]MCO5993432.1 hypothetical protein [Actinoallomurus rhizosphaericola]
MNGAERRWNPGNPAATPGEEPPSCAAPRPAGDEDALPYERVDMLIHRLFEVGLDLHAALGHIRERVEVEVGARKIYEAIAALDEAIKECRGVVIDLWPPERSAPDAGCSGVTGPVERADGPGAPRPVIAVSGETDRPEAVPPSWCPEEGPAAGPPAR